MKPVYLLLLFVFSTVNITKAQLHDGDILLDLSGNYNESLTGSGVSINSLSGKTKALNAGISAGFVTSGSLIVGIGAGYGRNKDTKSFIFQYPAAFALVEYMETKSNIFTPMVYLKYYKKTFRRIYMGLAFEANYAFINVDGISVKVGAPSYSEFGVISATSYPTFSQASSYTEKHEAVNLMLRPEVNCFLTNKLGLSLKIGGIRYTSYDSEEHEWHISLNPSSWEYGLFWRFGKK